MSMILKAAAANKFKTRYAIPDSEIVDNPGIRARIELFRHCRDCLVYYDEEKRQTIVEIPIVQD